MTNATTKTRKLLTLAVAGILALAFPLAAQAGSLEGTVVEAGSDDGIPALTVRAKAPKSAGGGEKVTTTDRDGAFRLPRVTDGRHLLTVSKGRDVLYRKVVEVKGKTTKTIRLERG